MIATEIPTEVRDRMVLGLDVGGLRRGTRPWRCAWPRGSGW